MHNKNRLKPALIALIIQLLIVVNPVLAATVAIQLSVNLPDEAKQNIIENLSLYQYRDSPLLDENNLGGLTVKGVSEIQTMLQTFGYFKAKISASTQKTNGNFNVVYTVDLGSPMIVDRVDIQINGAGKSDREVTKWVKSYPIVSGDILVQNKYEEAKKNLESEDLSGSGIY